eukprot:1454511-Alexandrium_andersonii.AAC.1
MSAGFNSPPPSVRARRGQQGGLPALAGQCARGRTPHREQLLGRLQALRGARVHRGARGRLSVQ